MSRRSSNSKPKSKIARLLKLVSRVALIAGIISAVRKRQMDQNDPAPRI